MIGLALVLAAAAGGQDGSFRRGAVPSLDGGFVYRLQSRYATSDEVVQIRRSDGRRRDVIDGNSVAVIRNGPYRGYLVVQRHKYHPQGGSYNPSDIIRPDGKVLMTIPLCDDDEEGRCVNKWLARRGWAAT